MWRTSNQRENLTQILLCIEKERRETFIKHWPEALAKQPAIIKTCFWVPFHANKPKSCQYSYVLSFTSVRFECLVCQFGKQHELFNGIEFVIGKSLLVLSKIQRNPIIPTSKAYTMHQNGLLFCEWMKKSIIWVKFVYRQYLKKNWECLVSFHQIRFSLIPVAENICIDMIPANPFNWEYLML